MNGIISALRFLTYACAILAAAAVGITAFVYFAEVVARYGLNSPINMASDLGSYLLLVCAFLSAPLVTRQRGHIAVTVVLETLPPAVLPKLTRVLDLVSAVVLLIVAFFVLDLCVRQYHQGVLTSMSNQIPRWWLTAVMAFGIVLSALNFIAPAGSKPIEALEY